MSPGFLENVVPPQSSVTTSSVKILQDASTLALFKPGFWSNVALTDRKILRDNQ